MCASEKRQKISLNPKKLSIHACSRNHKTLAFRKKIEENVLGTKSSGTNHKICLSGVHNQFLESKPTRNSADIFTDPFFPPKS